MSESVNNRVQQIFNYLKDKLSRKDRYAFDKEMLKDPFLADAMDGFSQLSEEELAFDLNLLDNKLSKRVHTKTRKLLPYVSIAASVVLVIGIGALMLINAVKDISEEKLAQETSVEKSIDTVGSSLLTPDESRKLLDEFEQGQEEMVIVAAEPKVPTDDKAYQAKRRQNEVARVEKAEPLPDSKEEVTDEEVVSEVEEMEMVDASADAPEPYVITVQEQAAAPVRAVTGKLAGVSTTKKRKRSKGIAVVGEDELNEEIPAETIVKPSVLHLAVQGRVIDGVTGEPIIGASVYQKNNGTITDVDGNFSFNIKNDSLIKIAFIGYKTKEISAIDLQNGASVIEIEADELALSEVVVVGYGADKKTDMTTGSVSRIEMNKEPPENLSYTIRTKNARIVYNSGFEKHAEPIGGIKEYGIYIKNNAFVAPDKSKKVILEFKVYHNGEVGTIKVIKSDGQEFTDEALRLVKEGPEWTPAENEGVKVQELVNLKIIFEKE